MAVITPRTPPGTMELLPRQQIAFQRMLDTIRRGYERFGFVPIETPAFELADVLLSKSGGETEKQVYFVQSTGALANDKRPDLALRFDLTVPLARYVSEHQNDLVFPFRRYQMQRVYRGERAQKGRYREFYQCDIDVIGRDGLPLLYDAEMPAVIDTIFSELGVGGFKIELNNRKILLGFLMSLGVDSPERRAAVMRELDKRDKLGDDEKVVANLVGGDDTQLSVTDARALLTLVSATGSSAAVLALLDAQPVEEPTFRQGVAELREVAAALHAFGIPEERWRLNLAIARGLDYYTGTVYETFLDGRREYGSVCSGGRYDDLASQYTTSRLPGVGISIGATRLFYVLQQTGLVAEGASTVEVLVTQLDAALMPAYLALAAELRGAGINTEIHADAAKLGKQFKYADKAGIGVAVVVGPDEQAAGVVTVKFLTAGQQVQVPRAEVAAAIRRGPTAG
ncbi:MAG: histidine--tRNA ligase [Myxococcales bacterium]|nr:histidine--tRNA ligase [Myxococcales bacterium]MCB9736932.1 histidine--tRNA ligase [Deltaproteobacteria bacterium]